MVFKFILALSLTFAFVSTQDPNSILRGDFGAFQRSLNQRVEGYQVIPDPTGTAPSKQVEKFLVRDKDCGTSETWSDCKTDRERSELSEKGRANLEGQNYWYGWSLYVPEDFPQIYPTKVALGQFHQDEGSPLWMFQQNTEGYSLEANFLSQNKLYLLIPDKELRKSWHKIEIEVLWTKKTDGYFRVWVNGVQKVNYAGPTMQNHAVYFKYGLYRSFISRYKKKTGAATLPTQYVYYASVKKAKSRKELLP